MYIYLRSFLQLGIQFPCFFNDFLTPPDPQKKPNPNLILDFYWKFIFSKLEILKMQKCSEMQARASFCKVTFKKHREGGPAAPPAPRVAS